MLEPELSDTQPAHSRPAGPQKNAGPSRKGSGKGWWRWAVLGLVLLLLVLAGAGAGAYLGNQAGMEDQRAAAVSQAAQALVEQYTLGVQELSQGDYDLARQRFEYVLARDPAFPGAAEGLAQAMQVLFATATPTPPLPTATLTPTPDLRPLEDRYQQALAEYAEGSWNAVLDTLITLRQADSGYRTVEVDSLLYRSLRSRGVEKIRDLGSLEGGIYDLSLAERFGPLDALAANYQYLARLYMIGLGFWEVYPQQAIYYFGQVASAAPYLRDASGFTAFERYYTSILQYAGQLAAQGAWCDAQAQYEFAQSVRPSGIVEPTLTYAAYECSPPTATFTPTVITSTLTLTPSPTFLITLMPTFGAALTATPSLTPAASATPTLAPANSATPTATVSAAPSPSATLPAPVSPTATSSQPPPDVATNTPTFTPTSTTPSPPDAPPATPAPAPAAWLGSLLLALVVLWWREMP